MGSTERVTLHRNRVWAAIKREALLVLAEGCCTVEALDELFMAHLKAGRAPFRYMDEIGLDVVLDIGKATFAHCVFISLLSLSVYRRGALCRGERRYSRGSSTIAPRIRKQGLAGSQDRKRLLRIPIREFVILACMLLVCHCRNLLNGFHFRGLDLHLAVCVTLQGRVISFDPLLHFLLVPIGNVAILVCLFVLT